MSEPITGIPHAKASNPIRPKDSLFVGKTRTSKSLKIYGRWSFLATPKYFVLLSSCILVFNKSVFSDPNIVKSNSIPFFTYNCFTESKRVKMPFDSIKDDIYKNLKFWLFTFFELSISLKKKSGIPPEGLTKILLKCIFFRIN